MGIACVRVGEGGEPAEVKSGWCRPRDTNAVATGHISLPRGVGHQSCVAAGSWCGGAWQVAPCACKSQERRHTTPCTGRHTRTTTRLTSPLGVGAPTHPPASDWLAVYSSGCASRYTLWCAFAVGRHDSTGLSAGQRDQSRRGACSTWAGAREFGLLSRAASSHWGHHQRTLAVASTTANFGRHAWRVNVRAHTLPHGTGGLRSRPELGCF